MTTDARKKVMRWSVVASATLVFVLPARGFTPDDNISIGLEGNPIDIPFDPDAPPWDKVIDDPAGAPWADDLYDLQLNQDVNMLTVIGIEEWLVVGGTRPWTDWHEELVNSPGWVWDQGQFNLPGVSGPFLEVRPPGGTGFNPPDVIDIVATDMTVDFFFEPLDPGTEVHIIKRLVYVGPDGMFNTPDTYQGPVTIREYPTPEPAGLLLMVGGGLMVLRRRSGA